MLRLPVIFWRRFLVLVQLVMRSGMVWLAVLLILLWVTHIDAQDDLLLLSVTDGGWNADGTLIALGYDNGMIQILDGATYQPFTSFQLANQVRTLEWHPSNPDILAATDMESGTFRSSLSLIDVTRNSVDVFLSDYQLIGGFDWSPDGTQLMIGTNIVFESYTEYPWREIWNLSSRTLVNKTTSADITDIGWSPDGKFLAITYLGDMFSPVVIGLDSTNNNKAFKDHTSTVTRIVWSPHGDLIATAGDVEDKTVRIWDVENATALHVFPDVYTNDLAWCPDNTCVATASTSVQLLHVDTGEVLNLGTFDNAPSTIDFSPYGGRLLFAGSSTMQRTGVRDATEQVIDGLHIIVPDASATRFRQIAESCVSDASTLRTIIGEPGQIQTRLDQVRRTSPDTIPPACAADLIAVAEAMMAEAPGE